MTVKLWQNSRALCVPASVRPIELVVLGESGVWCRWGFTGMGICIVNVVCVYFTC